MPHICPGFPPPSGFTLIDTLVDIPPPLENVDKDKVQSELLSLKKEIEALKLMHEQNLKETVGKVVSKFKQETDGMSPSIF